MEKKMNEKIVEKKAVNLRVAQLQTLVEKIIFKDESKGLDFAWDKLNKLDHEAAVELVKKVDKQVESLKYSLMGGCNQFVLDLNFITFASHATKDALMKIASEKGVEVVMEALQIEDKL